MASSYKAVAMANELFNELTTRLPVLAPFCSQSVDTNGNPLIKIASTGTPATTQENVFIRVQPQTTPFLTSIGTTPDTFSPTVIQFATEAPAAGSNHMSDYIPPTDFIQIFGSLFARGTRLEWYQSANTVVPVVGTLISTNLTTAWEAALYWGGLSSQ
jgi:hypothetical protein